MEFTIRKAVPEDAYERAVCHISSWRSAYKGIVPDEYLNSMSAEERSERYKKQIEENNEVLFYNAIYENKIIGLLCISKSRDEDKLNAGEVGAIYLIEEFWGKGYGREMMNFAIDTLKNMGYNEIILWVFEENNRARRFYEKCGFTFSGEKAIMNIGGKDIPKVRYIIKKEL